MKTLLSHFCEEFERRASPLMSAVDVLTERLETVPESDAFAAGLPGLADARGDLAELLEKVAEQRAYVIIFGPLKSGKSTLMNALAGAYVSEVTTLPAYPCMVYVSHGDPAELSVTHYDGRVEQLVDLAATRELMSVAHGKLVDSICEVEARGEDFDPAEDHPDALRRIDIRMQAEPLAESGAVLVDTPGLYSRMKFGYDLMTREFRDAAASAIFVVKTDNLFLEQVFDEFADLLRLFSRIFLVVNLDRAKQDLQPDGHLAPSLERSDPNRILEAFESLSMNADVKEAWQEGRLKIYPIDLLEAASRRLGGGGLAASPDSQQQESLAAFDGFTGDLTEYLNGSEALTAFLHNSLRQARTIFTRLEEACGPAIAGPLGNRLHYWTTEAQRGEELVDAFARLDAVPWEPTLAEMRDDVIRITREQCSDLRRKTAEEAEAALARWYDGDGSFAALVHEGLRAVLVECRDAIIEKAAQAATEALGREASGSGLDPQVCADLETVELSLTSVARELGGAVRSVAEDRAVVPDLPTRLIPVRRGFLDWLFLRSQDSMRRRMFGPDNAPTRPVSRVVKQSRLGAGRVVLGEAIRTRIDVFFTETLDRVAREVFGAQVAAISSRMRERVQEVSAHSLDRLEAARVQVQMLEGLRNERDDLLRVLGEAASGLADLEAQCGEPDSDDGESGGSDGEGPGPSLGGSHGGPESGPAPKVRAAAAGVGIGAVGFRIGDPDEMG